MTFYRGDAEEGNELGEQPANVTNGMATCTIDASNWEIADYTITAVHTPAEGDGPVQLVGTGSAVLTVLAEVPETYYWIGTAQELADFRDMVNNGETNARTTATLTADIDLEGKPWEPILNYAGTFDGQGHTIKGLYVSSSTGHAGLFGSVTGGTVKNLAVEGTVTADRGIAEISSYTGGVVGENSGGVINCAFSGEVTDSSNANQDTIIAAGGVVGYNNQSGKVENCCSTGSVANVDTSCNQGGFVAACAGGVVGYNYEGTVTNCYYFADKGDALAGIWKDNGNAGQAECKTKTAFESGEVAFLLNGSTSDGDLVWRQNVDNGAVPDSYPVPDDSHGIVYKVEGKEDVSYSNSEDGTWTISGCTVTLSEDAFTYNGEGAEAYGQIGAVGRKYDPDRGHRLHRDASKKAKTRTPTRSPSSEKTPMPVKSKSPTPSKRPPSAPPMWARRPPRPEVPSWW